MEPIKRIEERSKSKRYERQEDSMNRGVLQGKISARYQDNKVCRKTHVRKIHS